jgi:acetoin utilization deacetylase AcuC-like enzyme
MRRRWASHGVRFVYHDAYECALPGVPIDPMRAERVLGFLTEEGLLERDNIALPVTPSLRALLRVHAPDYLETLEQHEVPERIFGCRFTDEELEQALETQRLMVGGTILASRMALARRAVAVNLGGGLHHASRNSGLAFCVFNDIAVAIARLRARGFREPVLVVDLDVHDGNGTRAIFAHDPSVYTYSVHGEHWGETEAVASTSIALGDGVTDEVYLGNLLKTLPDVVERFQPGLVFYIAAADPAVDDAIGEWEISADGMLSRDRFVMDLLRREGRQVPVVVVLGGGYGDRAWRYWARFFSWLMTGSALEPPGNAELTLMRFRRIWRSLDPMALTSEPGDFSWKLSMEDLVGIVPGVPRQTRFLRYFSRHGVELVLERFGIFDQLRVRGFEYPTVDLDLSHPQGDTLRIYSGPDHRELLVEMRVDRSQRVVPGMEVLVIEWLLLQNPRAGFGPYRRPLPGQKYPGLGMLKEFFGWLLVVCEMLELDGVYYVPSHYHVAGQSRRMVRFLEPEHEARFRALGKVLDDLPLPEASRALSEGEVVDARTGKPFEWDVFPMVLPVSEALKQRVLGAEYEARVEEELAATELSLVRAEPSPAGYTRGQP